jgi:pimeloyl-ACP methyl ester carboxylesterase
MKWNDGHGKTGIEGAWKADGDTLIIDVWGTNSIRDFFGNFFVLPRKKIGAGVKAHRVWYSYARYILSIIPVWLGETGCKKVLIRGHSMGGAVAQIVAYVLGSAYDIRAVSCGGPMAGNKHFMRGCEDSVMFARYRGDIIPFLPCIPFFLHYKRPKTEMLLGKIDWPWKAHNKIVWRK